MSDQMTHTQTPAEFTDGTSQLDQLRGIMRSLADSLEDALERYCQAEQSIGKMSEAYDALVAKAERASGRVPYWETVNLPALPERFVGSGDGVTTDTNGYPYSFALAPEVTRWIMYARQYFRSYREMAIYVSSHPTWRQRWPNSTISDGQLSLVGRNIFKRPSDGKNTMRLPKAVYLVKTLRDGAADDYGQATATATLPGVTL